MSSSPSNVIEPVNGYFSAGSRRARQLAEAVPATRPIKEKTARARIAAAKPKKTRTIPMAPTPERVAKGLIVSPKVPDAPHRVVSQAEQLRDARELQVPKSRLTPDQLQKLHETGKLDHDHRTSEGMFEAARRLRTHYEGAMIGTLKAQDLNRVLGGGSSDENAEEAWVRHRDSYLVAIKLMGWSAAHPLRGAARLVVAVTCEDMMVYQAAVIHTGEARKERALSVGLDRLREGLFALAAHWKMI